MNIFTKRNALVGYVTLKRLEWRWRHRRTGRKLKTAAFVALALVSAGVLAGLLAVALRRQREETDAHDAEKRLQGFASADDEDLAELGAGLPEPGFAA